MPVALRAGASTLLDWTHSYPVCRVGVGTGACCCLLLLAVNSVLWPPNLGDGLYFNLQLALFPKVFYLGRRVAPLSSPYAYP